MYKSDTDLLVITFDLQQTLPVPTLMFYLRQLWVYNLAYTTVVQDLQQCAFGMKVLLVEVQMKSFPAFCNASIS